MRTTNAHLIIGESNGQHMNLVTRKPVISYANNKGADQSVHPRSLSIVFVVLCLNRITRIVAISLYNWAGRFESHRVDPAPPPPAPAPPPPKTGFLVTWLSFFDPSILCAAWWDGWVSVVGTKGYFSWLIRWQQWNVTQTCWLHTHCDTSPSDCMIHWLNNHYYHVNFCIIVIYYCRNPRRAYTRVCKHSIQDVHDERWSQSVPDFTTH